ncbi:hypothetical protein QJS10_CPB13g00697 [Acorus calamus]|uniref:Uncharacterized protein n=1 Tax=Acorus calamus TaxID=4465 RepID=A0AAV9DIE9_ACOCL|nr:hypothetical protein QJS10_CPB13g00697 [Acorus calamus]
MRSCGVDHGPSITGPSHQTVEGEEGIMQPWQPGLLSSIFQNWVLRLNQAERV